MNVIERYANIKNVTRTLCNVIINLQFLFIIPVKQNLYYCKNHYTVLNLFRKTLKLFKKSYYSKKKRKLNIKFIKFNLNCLNCLIV